MLLGIESSCDETAAAVVLDGRRILSNIVASQVELHQRFGGVVPEIACRKHVEVILPVIVQALDGAGISLDEIDACAVTCGPGLVGALLVGVSVAKAISFARGIPLVGVNHIEAHLYANLLESGGPEFPFVGLVVSGGHTDLVYADAHGQYEVLGRTRDDAAGEAFDKVARVMGLGYPGGPAIEEVSRRGNPRAVELPRPWLGEGALDFSFSGLKTAVVNLWRKADRPAVEDLAASFQRLVAELLVERLLAAAGRKGVRRVALAGGVAANRALREILVSAARERGVEVWVPSPALCTDNAAMVAAAGFYAYLRGRRNTLFLNAVPDLELGESGESAP